MKLPIVSGKEVVAVLRRVGFTPIDQTGSHIILTRMELKGKRKVVVPNHRELAKGTLLSILRQANLTKEQFQALQH